MSPDSPAAEGARAIPCILKSIETNLQRILELPDALVRRVFFPIPKIHSSEGPRILRNYSSKSFRLIPRNSSSSFQRLFECFELFLDLMQGYARREKVPLGKRELSIRSLNCMICFRDLVTRPICRTGRHRLPG